MRVWLETVKAGWARASAHNMGLIAAGVAFYMFLAMVPLLGAIVMLYGIVADPQTAATHIAELSNALPASAAEVIASQIQGVVETKGSTKGIALFVALGLALFGARNGAGSIIIALNIAFDCKEERGFLQKNLVALGTTLGSVVAAAILFVGIGAFGALQALVAPDSAAIAIVAQLATWLLLIVALAFCIALLFRYAPACSTGSMRWLSPGAIFAAVIAALLTFAFGVYVANFGNYNATYGALGGVVVLLTWIWLTSYVLLIGAECDVALLNRTDTPDPAQLFG
ncbi:YihY/virulence factor BrkB family protein [Croceicoccus ponticola]|uniref:YihY/virulence factor BrkB family protein n=2 Tax=Croceicoccus ponticola TaxID=2217664 RepID=A0A437GV80_9SPHN|nr:YihY/virulence factor BrkB family protein [Croceicoccus ponticola]